jgi:prolyl-tRNA synthetase
MAKHLTTREADYSKWYNELVVKADLAQNSGVRGSMVIKPYGYRNPTFRKRHRT